MENHNGDLPWSNLTKLLYYTGMSVIGSIGNIFAISAVMIEDHLRKKGNIFIANLTLADLLIPIVVFPANVVVILSEQEEINDLCQFQWFMVVMCCVVSLLTFMNISIENCLRLSNPPVHETFYKTERVVICLLLIWSISSVTVSVQYLFKLGPDYCNMKFEGSFIFHASTGILLVLLPIVVSFVCFIKTIIRASEMLRNQELKLPQNFTRNYSMTKTNFFVFLTFLVSWLPFGISVCVGSVYDLNETLYQNLSLVVLSNSCIKGFVYCIINRYFRCAFINLFHYCFCKTSVSFSSRRPRSEATRSNDYVRVHIIPGYNIYSSGSSNNNSHTNYVNSLASKKEAYTKFSGIRKPFIGGGRGFLRSYKNTYHL